MVSRRSFLWGSAALSVVAAIGPVAQVAVPAELATGMRVHSMVMQHLGEDGLYHLADVTLHNGLGYAARFSTDDAEAIHEFHSSIGTDKTFTIERTFLEEISREDPEDLLDCGYDEEDDDDGR